MAKPGSKPPLTAKSPTPSIKPAASPAKPKAKPPAAPPVTKQQRATEHPPTAKATVTPPPETASDPDCNQGEILSADLQATVGKNLHAARTSAALTLQQVAAASGMTFQYVSKVERGEKNLTLSTLHRLATVLRTDISALLRKPQT